MPSFSRTKPASSLEEFFCIARVLNACSFAGGHAKSLAKRVLRCPSSFSFTNKW
jgi:hypothetical protein